MFTVLAVSLRFRAFLAVNFLQERGLTGGEGRRHRRGVPEGGARGACPKLERSERAARGGGGGGKKKKKN